MGRHKERAPPFGSALFTLGYARRSELLLALVQRFVVLDARDPETRHAGAVDGALPAGELLDGEAVAVARLVDGEETAVDGRHHLRLAAHHPPRARRRRQAGER